MNENIVMAAAVLYVILNCAALFLYGSDKRRAVKDMYRISESTLLAAGFFGPFGALAGMRLFRHKTRKLKFKLVYVFAIMHVLAAGFLLWNQQLL